MAYTLGLGVVAEKEPASVALDAVENDEGVAGGGIVIELAEDMALSGGAKLDVEMLFDTGVNAAALAGRDESGVELSWRPGGAEPGDSAG